MELRLAGVAGPNTFHFALNGQGVVDPDAGRYAASGLNFRGWAGGEPLPLAGIEMLGAAESASYDSATGVAAIPRGTFNVTGIPGEFMVRLQPDDPAAPLVFSVKTDSFAPRAPAIAFGFPLPATADPKAYRVAAGFVRRPHGQRRAARGRRSPGGSTTRSSTGGSFPQKG